MTHTPGIVNFSAKMPKIGNFLVLLAVQIIKYIIYLSELAVALNYNHHCMIYSCETVQC